MLSVSIDYKDRVITNPGATFGSVKRAEWFRDPFIQKVIKAIDKADVIQDFCLRDRWGNIIPPEYLSNGTKSIIMMKYYKECPIYATRCGDNCVPYIEELSTMQDLHVVLHHCMPFSEGFQLYVNDVGKFVTSFADWVRVFYGVVDKMEQCQD